MTHVGRLADRADRRRTDRGAGGRPGVIARTWASLKLLVAVVLSPPGSALVAWRAARNHLHAKQTMEALPGVIARLSSGRSGGALGRVATIDASTPLVVTSDLHRCSAGRVDLVGAQDNRDLYVAMLDWYATTNTTLVENGDVEDFWMVGGSAWGSAYDLLRLGGAALVGRLGDGLRQATYREQLRRIVANNAAIYQQIQSHFAAAGRYHRTVGNHDDVFADERLTAALSEHVGPVVMSDWIVLRSGDEVEAIILHGHVADGWNGPGRSTLGKLSSWMADLLKDAPIPVTPDDLPSPTRTRELLSSRRRNGLLRVSPRFGASSAYDSLDEELLFDALGGAATVGPWILMGHTHFPVLQPASDTGARWWRYANSGHGLGAGLVTAIEWPGDDPAPRSPRLVAWVWADHPDWMDLVGSEATTHHQGRPVARIELTPSPDGRRLHAVRERAKGARAEPDTLRGRRTGSWW